MIESQPQPESDAHGRIHRVVEVGVAPGEVADQTSAKIQTRAYIAEQLSKTHSREELTRVLSQRALEEQPRQEPTDVPTN